LDLDVENRQSLNIKHEYELINLFRDQNFEAARLPGAISRAPDLIAGDGETVFILRVKATGKKRIELFKKHVWDLKRFSVKLKAKPILALKYEGHSPWIFAHLSALEDDGGRFAIGLEEARLKGFKINELISNELQQRLV